MGSEIETTTRQVGNYVIFYREERVLPCFLVTFDVGTRALQDISYHKGLHSELPVLVRRQDGSTVLALPKRGLVELNAPHVVLAPPPPRLGVGAYPESVVELPKQRVQYVRHEGEYRTASCVWYDRQHKTLSKRELKSMPRSAKQACRDGL